jgi:hypothetical protein
MTLSTALIESVGAEIDKAVAWLKEHEDGAHYEGVDKETRQKWYEGNLPSNFTSINLRLDWEVPFEQQDKFLDAGVGIWNVDFLDLLENGDIEAADNALLKAFDGVKKRGGIEPVKVSLIGASAYREFKVYKNTFEGTLYFRPLIEWPETEDGNGQG